MRSSYEYMNYLQVVQVIVRPPGSLFRAIQQFALQNDIAKLGAIQVLNQGGLGAMIWGIGGPLDGALPVKQKNRYKPKLVTVFRYLVAGAGFVSPYTSIYSGNRYLA